MASQEDKFFEAAGRQEKAASASALAGDAATIRPSLWRRGVRLLILLATPYFALCVGLFFFQKSLVYMPTQEERLSPQDYGFAAAQARNVATRTADNVEIFGWHVTSTQGGKQADENLAKAPLVVLYFPGNAGNKGDCDQRLRQIANLGAEAVCFDYRGYGDSEGSPSEEGLAADARAAWQFLLSKKVPPQNIIICGYSLGGGVAVRLASELCDNNTPPAGLVIESSFKSLTDVAKRTHWYVPVALLLSERFPSIERIGNVTCPLLAFHGTKDTLIPIQQGRELFAAARATSASGIEKQFVELPACDHTNVGLLNALEYRTALRSFMEKISPVLKPVAGPPVLRPHPLRKPRPERLKTGSSLTGERAGTSLPPPKNLTTP